MAALTTVDYLVIGHITHDVTPTGSQTGGTASYSSLTALALGMRVGLLTSLANDFELPTPLNEVALQRLPSENTTTFENLYDAKGNRQQIIHHRAAPIAASDVPQEWRGARIVHLAPVADEVDAALAARFPTALVGVTPQGWMRAWDAEGKVRPIRWQEPQDVLRAASVVVMSIEDIDFDEQLAREYARQSSVVIVTRGADGCSVHWRDSWQEFPAPQVPLVDPTGAGDIFATSYFHRLLLTNGDPHEAARFAVEIASMSVSRRGLDGIPSQDEIRQAMDVNA